MKEAPQDLLPVLAGWLSAHAAARVSQQVRQSELRMHWLHRTRTLFVQAHQSFVGLEAEQVDWVLSKKPAPLTFKENLLLGLFLAPVPTDSGEDFTRILSLLWEPILKTDDDRQAFQPILDRWWPTVTSYNASSEIHGNTLLAMGFPLPPPTEVPGPVLYEEEGLAHFHWAMKALSTRPYPRLAWEAIAAYERDHGAAAKSSLELFDEALAQLTGNATSPPPLALESVSPWQVYRLHQPGESPRKIIVPRRT